MYVGSKNATRRNWRGSNVNYEHNAAAWPRCSPAEHLGAVPASPSRTGLCKPLSRRPPEASGSHEGWGTVLQAAPLTRLLRAWENPSTGEAIPLESVSTQSPSTWTFHPPPSLNLLILLKLKQTKFPSDIPVRGWGLYFIKYKIILMLSNKISDLF